jgi:hypothetical protein
MEESDVIRYIETGKKTYHSQFCGQCAGAGCPEVRLLSDEETSIVMELEELLKDMSLPASRKDLSKVSNIVWLWRWFPINNRHHPNRKPAMRLIFKLWTRIREW